jgi:TatD DNase family protein
VIVDLHCHLDLYPDPYAVAKMCDQKGLYILSVTTTPKAWNGTSKLTEGNDRIKTALGLHPQLAHQRIQELELFDSLLPQTKYVGEIGLDGGKEFKEHWNQQLQVFRHILKSINAAGGKIMSIHSRGSANAVLLELNKVSGVPILHWFTGSKTELKNAIDRDCWFSVNPVMLQTKKGKELVSLIPRNRILTESDGPFAKFNGKKLMPWDVELIFSDLAEIWKVSNDDAQYQIYSNFLKLVS